MSRTTVPHDAATMQEWTGAIADPDAAPAGGSAAALGGALAASAVRLVASLTLARDRYAPAHQRAAAARRRAERLEPELLALARRDAEAFAGFARALALPRATDAERAARGAAKRQAMREAGELQLDLLRRLAEVADLAAELAEHGLTSALGDAATAGFLSAGAARSAYWAVRADLQDEAGDDAVRRGLEEGRDLLERVEATEWRIRRLLNERIR